MPRKKVAKLALAPSDVATALYEARGFISVAARRLGCSEITVRRYIERYKVVEQARFEAKEAMKDFAEGALFAQIQEGEVASTIFFLKTQAKDRGYVERSELSGPENEPLRIRLVWNELGSRNAQEDASLSLESQAEGALPALLAPKEEEE